MKLPLHANRSFFSTLPEDDILLRIFNHLPEGCQIAQFQDASPFSRIVRRHFTAACLSSARSRFSCAFDDRTLALAGPVAENPAFIFDRCLPALRTLTVVLDDQDNADEIHVLCNHAYFMASRVGPQLRQLAIQATDFSAWSVCGMAQQWGAYCTSLKVLTLDCDSWNDLAPMWQVVGATLERLRFNVNAYEQVEGKDVEHLPHTMNSIRLHCARLTHVHFAHPHLRSGVSAEQFADFLASFGDRLLWTKLYDADVLSCSTILAACPNVRVSYVCRNNFDAVKSLGSHLTAVKFNFVHGNSISETLMSCCVSLSRIEVWHCPSLTELDFDFDTLKVIANSTGRLEKMELLFQFIEDVDIFDYLVRMNPRLDYVRIVEHKEYLRTHEGDVLELLAKLLRAFAPCRSFKLSLRVGKPADKALENLLVPYRNRGLQREFTFWSGDGKTFESWASSSASAPLDRVCPVMGYGGN